MSREEMSDPDGPEFDEALREIFRDLEGRSSMCPGVDELEKFAVGNTPREEHHRIETHIAACGICDLLVEKIKNLDQEGGAEGPGPAPSDWDEADRRLTRRMRAYLRSRGAPKGRAALLRAMAAFLQKPTVAYAIALILCYPAYRGITSEPKAVGPYDRPKITAERPLVTNPPLAATGVKAPRVFDLNGVRVGSRRSDLLQLTERDKVFGLSFFVPVRGTLRYTAAIRNEAGATIGVEQELPSQETGNFILFCDRQWFSPGSYQLTVKEFDRHTERISRTIVFRFRV
jgi:hypothetical protein